MARIQVLHLPATIDEESPFAIVIDQAGEDLESFTNLDADKLKADLGARAVILTDGTVDVA